MLGKCKCGKSLRESSEILLGNCRRCQVAYIGEHLAKGMVKIPKKPSEIKSAQLAQGKKGA